MSVDDLNQRIKEMCDIASEELREAYTRLDVDEDALDDYAEWFKGITHDLAEVQTLIGGPIADRVSYSALSACEAILSLRHVPHEGHIKSIIWIRLVLAPHIEPLDWDDWPFDISGYISEDEDSA